MLTGAWFTFFQDEAAGNSVSNREKATLLCLALKWFSGKRLSGKAVSKSSDELAELESQMWLCIINDRIHASEEVLSTAEAKPSTKFCHTNFLHIND